MKKLIIPLAFLACMEGFAQKREYTPSPVKGAAWNTPGNLNPFIPGYFADPTIRKFGDTYYLYATTDGTGNGYGPAQVWVSKDFVNWKNVILNWPTTEVVWAPDVVQQPDGTYRYYYCEPCNINIGEADSPLGPWKNILGKTDAVMVPDRYVHNVITLDPQLFTDDNHQQYLYFTTWGIYDGFGCGVARLNDGTYNIEDLQAMPSARRWNENAPYEIAADKFFAEKSIIPNTQLKDIFEAPFVFKRNGIYYFTYSSGSCHTDTYRVQYATSTVGPMGPFEYKGELLTTNEDGTVHGPGHHSILEDDGHYYIVYHRHDIPKAIHGFNRQVCIDELTFDGKGNINPIAPTHDGLLPASLAKKAAKAKKNACVNLAFGAKATASSFYKTPSPSGRAGEGLEFFLPSHATDDNNATLWKAADCNAPAWLQIDLGKAQRFNQVWTQFEFPTFFYQYKIETSLDGNDWALYADRTDNTQQGSPMVDEGATTARYLRVTITDTQKNGHFPAIWNVKVFNATKKNNPLALLPNTDGIDLEAVNRGYPSLHKKDVEPSDRAMTAALRNLIIDINADDYKKNTTAIANKQGGKFTSQGKDVVVEIKKGKYAFYFDGETTLTSDFALPRTMTYNAPYTITAWTLNPTVEGIETVAEFTQRRNDLATTEFRQGTDRQSGLVAHNASFENFGCPRECTDGANQWQHWTVAYDGYMERIYLNGRLVTEKNSFLMIRPEGNITLGSSMDGANKFSGYLHSLRFYDRCLNAEEIQAQYREPSSTTDRMSLSDIDMQLKAEVLTPEYIKLTVVDADGNPIRSGMLTYTYNIEDAPQAQTPAKAKAQTRANTKAGAKAKAATAQAKLCTATITDDEGTFTKTLTATVDVNPAQFRIMRHPEPMRLEGAGADFTDKPLDNGARVLHTLTGDFVMQARVSAFDGQDTRRTPAYNEAGIIAIECPANPDGTPSPEDRAGDRPYIHNGVFPSYNCGNMLTQVRHGRPQFPVQNGWQYDPWLQLQRVGNHIYARRSADGKTWTDMPGSPMTVNSPTLQLGVYQTTYTHNTSWAELSDFTIWQKHTTATH